MCVCELHLHRSLDQEAPVEVDSVHLEACVCLCASRSVVSDCAMLWTGALQAPLSMELSRQEYWSG